MGTTERGKTPSRWKFSFFHAEIHTINALYITTMNVKEQYYVLLFIKYIQMVRGI